jgi:hypothetical protein
MATNATAMINSKTRVRFSLRMDLLLATEPVYGLQRYLLFSW